MAIRAMWLFYRNEGLRGNTSIKYGEIKRRTFFYNNNRYKGGKGREGKGRDVSIG